MNINLTTMDNFNLNTLNEPNDSEGAGSFAAGISLPSSVRQGEDLMEETLLANLALESPRDTDSSAMGALASPIDPAEERRLLNQSDTDLEGTLMASSTPVHEKSPEHADQKSPEHAVQSHTDTSPTPSVHERPKKLSGAARRRKKKERGKQACPTGEESTGAAAPSSTHHNVERGVEAARPSHDPSTSETTPKHSAAEDKSKKKRPLGSEETPPGGTNRPPPKVFKRDYRTAVEKSLQVAVVFRDNLSRKMTEDEGQHVRSQLIRLIDMLPVKSDSQGPQFNRSGLDQGVFKITCADQHTLNWLKESVLRIEPIGACNFQLVELAELSRLNKVKVWVPGVPSDPKLILERLSKQNCGLVTSEWRILYRQEKPEGQLLVLGVDDASLSALRYTGGKAHLELSRVTFELPSQGQEATKEKSKE